MCGSAIVDLLFASDVKFRNNDDIYALIMTLVVGYLSLFYFMSFFTHTMEHILHSRNIKLID